jgi:hypothetical protein
MYMGLLLALLSGNIWTCLKFCVYVLDGVFSFCIWPFPIWVVPVFLLEYCIITLRICCLPFDVLSAICRLIYSYVVVFLPVLCLMPCLIFVWGPPLLATDACYWVGWGLRSLNAAFPCRKISGEHIVARLSVRTSIRTYVRKSRIRVRPITSLFEVGF